MYKILIAAVALAFTSCTGEGLDGQDGAPGLDGQDGIDGADGAQGPPGEQGAAGLDGETVHIEGGVYAAQPVALPFVSGAIKSADALCDDGDVVLSGGCELVLDAAPVAGVPQTVLIRSTWYGPGVWRCTADSPHPQSSGGTVTASAMCLGL